MGVTQNSYIPRACEVSDLKVSGATRPRPLNQILPSHLVYNYYINYPSFTTKMSACSLFGSVWISQSNILYMYRKVLAALLV